MLWCSEVVPVLYTRVHLNEQVCTVVARETQWAGITVVARETQWAGMYSSCKRNPMSRYVQ